MHVVYDVREGSGSYVRVQARMCGWPWCGKGADLRV